MSFEVDCAAGQTVGAALAQGTDQSGRLFITIKGVCHESVYIARDDVVLMGASEGAGLAAPSSNSNVLTVAGGQRVHLQDVTLQGGASGFLVHHGSSITGEGVRITGATVGLGIWDGVVRLSGNWIEHNGYNVSVATDGHLFVSQQSAISHADYMGVNVLGEADFISLKPARIAQIPG